MDIIKKDATITNTDDAFPGSFRVVLSAPTKDRDGDTLLPEEWKQPLPEHITFDIDHEMSVRGTIGSGKPYLNDAGQVPEAPVGALIVDGTYWSGELGQETRSKVGEGHIKTTSVAFMTDRSEQKDGNTVVKRELLNGAFVAIPSNREALVMSSKDIKAGARNSAADAKQIQAIHDASVALGADCAAPGKSFALGRKDADTEDASDPVALIQATDAAIDEAIDLFAAVDIMTLPAEVQQAIALVQAADTAIDELMDVAGIPDPDEDAEPADVSDPAAAEKSPAAASDTKAAEADSSVVTDEEIEAKALAIQLGQFL